MQKERPRETQRELEILMVNLKNASSISVNNLNHTFAESIGKTERVSRMFNLEIIYLSEQPRPTISDLEQGDF